MTLTPRSERLSRPWLGRALLVRFGQQILPSTRTRTRTRTAERPQYTSAAVPYASNG